MPTQLITRAPPTPANWAMCPHPLTFEQANLVVDIASPLLLVALSQTPDIVEIVVTRGSTWAITPTGRRPLPMVHESLARAILVGAAGDIDAWVTLGADGTATCSVPRAHPVLPLPSPPPLVRSRAGQFLDSRTFAPFGGAGLGVLG